MDEKKRIESLLEMAGVSPEERALLEPVIENVTWMKKKLDEARRMIENASITVPYQNGGGQAGVRENPAFKAYEGLWKSYMLGVAKVMEFLPEAKAEVTRQTDQPQTVLEKIMERRERS